MLNFADAFTPKAVAARWTEAASNRIPMIGEVLFPADKKVGLDLSFLKGSKGLPISLMPSAFDAMATFRDREGFEILETEMPFFREGYKIKEKDRQELLKFQDLNSPYVRDIISKIFNDTADLIEGANVATERERMQLLFPEYGNAKIIFVANGVTYEYNYDQDGSWKANNYFELTGTSAWSDAEHANPFKDIGMVQKAVNGRTGANLKVAIMNSNTFGALTAMSSVYSRYIARAGVAMTYLTDEEVKRVVEDTAKIRIVVYDKQYRNENKETRSFVPDGYVSLIPEGALGKTWYGTTPEEADLMANPKADVSIVNTGVAITREVTVQPVNTNIFASQIVLPSFERMDDVALLKVY